MSHIPALALRAAEHLRSLPLQLTILAVVVGLIAMGFWNSKNHFPVDGRTVLLTGGSSGMGRSVAKLLAQKGANIVIVARDVGKLEKTIEYIQAAAFNPQKQRFHYISADLTKSSEAIRMLEETKAWNNNTTPDIVWCVAGASHPQLFLDNDIEHLHRGMDQNYWSVAYTAHATLRDWLSPSPAPASPPLPRHLIFTSSVIAFSSLVGYTGYAPAKHAIRALSDSLYQELLLYRGARLGAQPSAPPHDVQIHTVFPGTILSPGFETENETKPGITKQLEEADTLQTEEQVAAASVLGLERGEYMVTTSMLGALMRGGAWMGSVRNRRVRDTVMGWLAGIVWLFVEPDMERKITRWGREKGVQSRRG